MTADEFDVVFGLEKALTVEEVVESTRRRAQQVGDEDVRRLLERLRSLGTQHFVYGALCLRRLPGPESREPRRIQISAAATARDFQRLFAWRNHRRQPDFPQWLARSRPRLASNLELTARYVVKDGELGPSEFVFSVDGSFRAALRPDGWVVPLVARLIGTASVEQVFDTARSAGEMPQDFPLAAFVKLIADMIERGFLEVDFQGGTTAA